MRGKNIFNVILWYGEKDLIPHRYWKLQTDVTSDFVTCSYCSCPLRKLSVWRVQSSTNDMLVKFQIQCHGNLVFIEGFPIHWRLVMSCLCLFFKLVLLSWWSHLEDSQLASNGSLQSAHFQLWMRAKGTQMFDNIWVIAKQFLFSKLSVYNSISNINCSTF